MRVLITNNSLSYLAGSEMFVVELAKALKRRGHQPIAYSKNIGAISELLKAAKVPVVSDLDLLAEAPDVIHGQHHMEAVAAILHFPSTPAIYVAHGWVPWQETAPKIGNIKHYVAVSELIRQKVATSVGIPSQQVELIPNPVDTFRFSRKEPLRTQPETAIIFSNYASPNSRYAQLILAACQKVGIKSVRIIGSIADSGTENPELELAKTDIVFAVGRSAIEAMSSSCAVIVASPDGLGGMVTPDNVNQMCNKNFALDCLNERRLTVGDLVSELKKYNIDNITSVTSFIKSNLDIDEIIENYITLYRKAIETFDEKSNADTQELTRDTSKYLEVLMDRVKAIENAEMLEKKLVAAKRTIEQQTGIINFLSKKLQDR